MVYGRPFSDIQYVRGPSRASQCYYRITVVYTVSTKVILIIQDSSLCYPRPRQNIVSGNMAVLGNIWEGTTETLGWLVAVRKWSGSFLATAHFVFWRQRCKQRQALWKAAAVRDVSTCFICANDRKDSQCHIVFLSLTSSTELSPSIVLLWVPCKTMRPYPTCHGSEGESQKGWGHWHPLVAF